MEYMGDRELHMQYIIFLIFFRKDLYILGLYQVDIVHTITLEKPMNI